jgi:hypothetical protein
VSVLVEPATVDEVARRWDARRLVKWRTAERLWHFTALALPWDERSRDGAWVARRGCCSAELMDEACERGIPVAYLHGRRDERLPTFAEFGRATGWHDTRAGLLLTGFVAVPWRGAVSVAVSLPRGDDGAVWRTVEAFTELSLVAEGNFPSARVTGLFEMTPDEVAAAQGRE